MVFVNELRSLKPSELRRRTAAISPPFDSIPLCFVILRPASGGRALRLTLADQLRSLAVPRLRGWFPSFLNPPKPERVHHCQRPRSHGEDVAQDAAYAGGRALEGLDVRRMIVRLDLEGTGPAVSDVDNAGILSRPLHH